MSTIVCKIQSYSSTMQQIFCVYWVHFKCNFSFHMDCIFNLLFFLSTSLAYSFSLYRRPAGGLQNNSFSKKYRIWPIVLVWMKEIIDFFEKTMKIRNILFNTAAVFAVIALYCLQVFPLYVNTLTSEKIPYSCEVGPFEGGVLLKVCGSLKHPFFFFFFKVNLVVSLSQILLARNSA